MDILININTKQLDFINQLKMNNINFTTNEIVDFILRDIIHIHTKQQARKYIKHNKDNVKICTYLKLKFQISEQETKTKQENFEIL